jgi:hypothetical protein
MGLAAMQSGAGHDDLRPSGILTEIGMREREIEPLELLPVRTPRERLKSTIGQIEHTGRNYRDDRRWPDRIWRS